MQKKKFSLRRILLSGLAVAFGVTLGGTLIPRLLHPEFYGTWKNVAGACAVSFLCAFAASVAVNWLMWRFGLFEERKKSAPHDEIEP